MLVFVAGYSWGLGAVVWVYFGELLPLRARGKVAGLATAFVWLCAFVVTSWFSSMLVNVKTDFKTLFILEECFSAL